MAVSLSDVPDKNNVNVGLIVYCYHKTLQNNNQRRVHNTSLNLENYQLAFRLHLAIKKIVLP